MEGKVVKVWDIAVRVFHWSLVFFFALAYISEDIELIHEYSGYVVLALVGFRFIWGFIGTKYARFYNFVKKPSVVIGYVKSLAHPKRYLGHNPAGGAMIIILLVSISLTGITGYKTKYPESNLLFGQIIEYTLIGEANADSDERHDKNEFWEEIHEFFANLMLLLIFIHIVGVLYSSLIHNENLIKSMIGGTKKVPNEEQ